MRKPSILWSAFAAIGLLLWLSSIGVGTHRVYRLMLVVAVLLWSAWFAAADGSRRARTVIKALVISVALIHLAEYLSLPLVREAGGAIFWPWLKVS
jgi:hypothetical protein